MADVAVLTLKIASAQAEANGKRTDAMLRHLDKSAKTVAKSFQSLGIKMTAAITAPFALAARAAIRASAEYEKARISFGVFVGDMQKGAAVFGDIVQMAAKTPLNVSSLQTAAQILLATGAATADSLIPTLESLGNVARADSSILQRLALNFSQVATQGRLTGRELRDFAVAGVPLLQTLATQMGKTTAQIKDMVSKGRIGFGAVTRAFKAMSSEGGKFAGLMEKLSQTLSGRWTTAVDNVTITLAQFADLFRTELKGLLDIVIRVAQGINSLSPTIKRAIAIAATIAAALGPALLIIGGIITAVAAVKASFVFLGIAIVPIVAVLIKVALVVGGIALAVEGLRRVFGITWAEIGTGLMNFARMAVGFFANFRHNWDTIIKWLGDNWRNLLVDMIANTVIFSKHLLDNFIIAFNAIGGLIGVFTGFVLDEWQNMLAGTVNQMVAWAGKIVDFFFDIGKKVVLAVARGIKGEALVDIDFLDRLVEGAARTGTLTERINAELEGVNFKSLTDGLQNTVNPIKGLRTDFQFFADKSKTVADNALKAAGLAGGLDAGESPSTKLAGALEAGSAEAFKLLASQRDPEGKKTAKKNLTANERSAFALKRIATDGVKITGLKEVKAF